MFCGICGTNMSENSVCPKCGARFDNVASPGVSGGQGANAGNAYPEYGEMNYQQQAQFKLPKIEHKVALVSAILLLLSTFVGKFCTTIFDGTSMFGFGKVVDMASGFFGESNIFTKMLSSVGILTLITAVVLGIHAFHSINLFRNIILVLESIVLAFCMIAVMGGDGLEGKPGLGFWLALLGVIAGFAANAFSGDSISSMRAGTWQCPSCWNINPDSVVKCQCGRIKP